MQELLKASDVVTVLARIDPDAQGVGTVSSIYVDASKYNRILAVVQAGDLGASATLDAKLRQATDVGGTGVKDITGKTITQLTQAGTDSDKLVLINLKPEELDVQGGFDFVKLDITVGVAASETAGLILGINARYGPGSHIAAVDEVLS